MDIYISLAGESTGAAEELRNNMKKKNIVTPKKYRHLLGKEIKSCVVSPFNNKIVGEIRTFIAAIHPDVGIMAKLLEDEKEIREKYGTLPTTTFAWCIDLQVAYKKDGKVKTKKLFKTYIKYLETHDTLMLEDIIKMTGEENIGHGGICPFEKLNSKELV